ncbi:sodium:solute symporter [Vreelandella nanhaiensis]|uniref:Sodium:solute symporter n=1 Tax=Vreelandella nanhaiensis TaxID=1258546 RepID=A0A3S0YLZ6_9GAMM|nr:sodium:solute symporter [Halomonas nanhaiensis]RUR33616.1 sodium:solute symporter [Halomonas nanhaiensis]
MLYLTLAVLGAALCCFAFLGLKAQGRKGSLDDYVTARNSQTSTNIGLSLVASGMGAWILFAPPEIGAFVGPVALAGYALGSALPLVVLGLYGPMIRRALPEGRSIAEFAEACYGRGVRYWVSLVSIGYMACFLAAELTAIGAITSLLSKVPPSWVIIGVTLTTLLYTVKGGLRASLATDRWQAWLLFALLLTVAGVTLWRLPAMPEQAALPAIPASSALSVALTLVIAVTAANIFHQGYWQRVWAARDDQSLGRGAWLGGAMTVGVIMLIGGLGMVAAASGVPLGEPPMPFFALLENAPAWVGVVALVLAVTLVASSVDTLQSGIASLLASRSEQPSVSLTGARWTTVVLMVPVIIIALQGLSVLRLFLIADLLCAATVMPVLLGLWQRMTPLAAIGGGLAGLLGAILPGWTSHGELQAGVIAATFPGGVPTLAPFLGALVASTSISVMLAYLGKHQRVAQ